MTKDCVIVFDQNEYGIYFTGQQLTGKVIITLNKPKSYKGIKLEISGYAQCQWREKHGQKKAIQKQKTKKKHMFRGHEDYIVSSTFLEGCETGRSFTIDSGTHTYTFACPIPVNCPSSYEGTYGHIRYTAKVTFFRSIASTRTLTKGFTVLKLMDLNKESSLLKSPACSESIENFCSFYGKPVHLRVSITQMGFVPGQMILVSTRLNNESKVNVKNLLITLSLRATYISDTPSIRTVSEKVCLVKKYCGPVAYNSVKDFVETMRVPATSPTCDHLSKVVRVSYEICVKAIMNHFMSNPKTVIPITIGSVPLVSLSAEVENSAVHEMPTTSANADEFELHEERETSYELPPPSYEEAVFMSANIADADENVASTVMENTPFVPRFPVYDVDNIVMTNPMAQRPPPNPPQKRRRRRNKTHRNHYGKY